VRSDTGERWWFSVLTSPLFFFLMSGEIKDEDNGDDQADPSDSQAPLDNDGWEVSPLELLPPPHDIRNLWERIFASR
jgi:hypothetical protein